MPPSNAGNGASSKASKSLIVTLSLSSGLLKKFAPEKKEDTPAVTATAASSSPSSSAVNGNPNANGNDEKRKSLTASKPAVKRSASQAGVDEVPKPRGKPGPKKKVKVDGVNGTAIPISAPKINPKANTGAINANLRALDRSGNPCRRWKKAAFRLKSFTGIAWGAATWGSQKGDGNGSSDVRSMDSSQTSDTAPNPKGTLDSSAVPSEKSHNGDGLTPMAVPVA